MTYNDYKAIIDAEGLKEDDFTKGKVERAKYYHKVANDVRKFYLPKNPHEQKVIDWYLDKKVECFIVALDHMRGIVR